VGFLSQKCYSNACLSKSPQCAIPGCTFKTCDRAAGGCRVVVTAVDSRSSLPVSVSLEADELCALRKANSGEQLVVGNVGHDNR
jgi:hypothetical protein